MSFSGKVKEELSQQWSSARHCQIAEIAALIGMCGAVTINSFNQYGVKNQYGKSGCCKKSLYIDSKNI